MVLEVGRVDTIRWTRSRLDNSATVIRPGEFDNSVMMASKPSALIDVSAGTHSIDGHISKIYQPVVSQPLLLDTVVIILIFLTWATAHRSPP